MILVDTSVWIDHLREGDAALAGLLEAGRVLGHPWVTGELALGRLRDRAEVLGLLGALPQAAVATTAEVRALVDRHGLAGSGVGWVDAQLLASARITPDARLWTPDRRLRAAADSVGAAAGGG